MDLLEKDPLAAYLDSLARDDGYRVVRRLKESPHETTEVVFFQGAHGAELGPFVRKRISASSGLGSAYATLQKAQEEGHRFKHLPRIYDVHERDGDLIVMMEYVKGRTLAEEVYERDGSVALAQQLFPLICDGVTELHRRFPSPIIHRDLKPSNILVNEGNLTIIDLGIARSYHGDAMNDTTRFGTRAYAPPEQFGYGQTDERSDVYALGMILYYLLCEKTPDAKAVSMRFPELGNLETLRAVIVKATAFDPDSRYQSTEELKEAFLRALGAPDTVHDASAGREWPSRRPRPSEVVGLIWDAAVIIVWLFFMAVCIYCTVDITNEPETPFFIRYRLFMGCIAVFFTGIGYGLLDKRWLSRNLSFMAGQTFMRGLVVALCMIAAAFLELLFVAIMLALTGSGAQGL